MGLIETWDVLKYLLLNLRQPCNAINRNMGCIEIYRAYYKQGA
ncbi:hypothetical protein C809_00321 [Lachnospiraceae bacterium MD335]|nr:hypothetical protein C809_00321 [Lachnospiraceae bacterium MD335]